MLGVGIVALSSTFTHVYSDQLSDINEKHITIYKEQPLSSVRKIQAAFDQLKMVEQVMPVYAVVGSRVLTRKGFVYNHAVLVKGNSIVDVVPVKQLSSSIQRVDFSGLTLAPGLIDLQLNGCGGVMFNDDISARTLEQMHRACLKTGVTTFLPTMVSSSEKEVVNGIKAIDEFSVLHPFSAPGLHLEGPWLNRNKKGIHNVERIQPYHTSGLSDVVKAHSDSVMMITLAPEKVPLEAIHQLVKSGVLVSIGHTQASAVQTEDAFRAGAGFVTHLFNAMSGITAREPGVIGSTLASGKFYAGIIADGMHVDWRNIVLARERLGQRLVLVTDGTAATASPETSSFVVGGTRVSVKDGRCVDNLGRLGGSSLTMIKAVNNMIRYAGVPEEEALRMGSLYPARAIGADDFLGTLAPGYLAHMVAIDKSGDVIATINEGKIVLHHESGKTRRLHTMPGTGEARVLHSPPVVITPTKDQLGAYTAEYIAHKINTFIPSENKPFFVLGLPTGSTPLATYQHLIKMYREKKVSFKHVVTFNMDEYFGLPASHEQSYHFFMQENFFRHIDIPAENIFILDGMASNTREECLGFEKKINKMGGIDLFLGGIGSNGHIAFNEPGTPFDSMTHLANLTASTIQDNARFFNNDTSQVPKKALTIGIATLMNAREVIILATGPHKSAAIAKAVKGQYSRFFPASALQAHPAISFFCDIDAIQQLTGFCKGK